MGYFELLQAMKYVFNLTRKRWFINAFYATDPCAKLNSGV